MQQHASVGEATALFAAVSIQEAEPHSPQKTKDAPSERVKDFPAFDNNPAAEIVFYDVETTIPSGNGSSYEMIEFGAVVLDKRSFAVKVSYQTLIKSDKITTRSREVNKITEEMVRDAPSFTDVADKIFSLLDGRIWAGHNIIAFDNQRIRQEFSRINKPCPKCAGIIDTLQLLRNTFGPRAGDLKMSSLGNYFELGQEPHRALEDTKMTIEVFKNCCLTWFLEQMVVPKASVPPSGSPKARKSRASPLRNSSNPPGQVKTQSVEPVSPVSPYKAPQNADHTVISNSSPTAYPSPSAHKIEITQVNSSIVAAINAAISTEQMVWISYERGSKPKLPRPIVPLKWIAGNVKFEALCKLDNMPKFFVIARVLEVRNERWS